MNHHGQFFHKNSSYLNIMYECRQYYYKLAALTKSVDHLYCLRMRWLTGTVLVNRRNSEEVLISLDELVGHIVTVNDLLFQDSPEQATGLSLLKCVILNGRASIFSGSCPGKRDLFGGDTTAFNGSRGTRNIQNCDLNGFLFHTKGVAGSDDVLASIFPACILDGQSGGGCSGLNINKIRRFKILSSLGPA